MKEKLDIVLNKIEESKVNECTNLIELIRLWKRTSHPKSADLLKKRAAKLIDQAGDISELCKAIEEINEFPELIDKGYWEPEIREEVIERIKEIMDTTSLEKLGLSACNIAFEVIREDDYRNRIKIRVRSIVRQKDKVSDLKNLQSELNLHHDLRRVVNGRIEELLKKNLPASVEEVSDISEVAELLDSDVVERNSEVWNRAKSRLKDLLDQSSPKEVVKTWVNSRFNPELEEAARESLSEISDLDWILSWYQEGFDQGRSYWVLVREVFRPRIIELVESADKFPELLDITNKLDSSDLDFGSDIVKRLEDQVDRFLHSFEPQDPPEWFWGLFSREDVPVWIEARARARARKIYREKFS
ncbi:MAG: hypothetical protein ABEJ72_10435 [Candidatus Aenigmatarchaeota archaeon]